MRVAREVVGPVPPIRATDDYMQAIKLANDSQYGLGQAYGLKISIKQRNCQEWWSGVVSVNNIVTSDPRVPFGGVKKSYQGMVC